MALGQLVSSSAQLSKAVVEGVMGLDDPGFPRVSNDQDAMRGVADSFGYGGTRGLDLRVRDNGGDDGHLAGWRRIQEVNLHALSFAGGSAVGR